MNQEPEKRPAKSDALRKKKLATARKKKKQRRLMLCAAAVILVIAIVAVLCVALIVNKSKNPENIDKNNEVTTATKAAEPNKTEETETTKKPAETTAAVTETPAETTAETAEPEKPVALVSKLFSYTDAGKVSGAPYNYKDLSIHVGSSTVSAASYSDSYRDYVKGWYDALKGSAANDFTSEGGGQTWFHLIFDGIDHDTRLALRVNGSRISYGALSGMPQKADAIAFSVGGVSLGSSADTVKGAFGSPTSENDSILNYEFESGAVLYFRLSGGKVSQIYLTMKAFSEENP